MQRQIVTIGSAVAWMVLIFVLSAQSGDVRHTDSEIVLRKLAHIGEYLVLTLLLARALPRHAISFVALVAVVYATTDEWHQRFVPGREGTPRDVLIDLVGITLAALGWQRLRSRDA